MHVELKDIRKYFGNVKANDGISLSLEEGRIYGLLGENGAGKSTLMKILSGYQPPDSGVILLDGQPKHFTSPAQALENGVGMLYQDPLDFPPFRIIENYLLGRDRNYLLDFQTAGKELSEIAARYDFNLDLHAYVDSLSLGERQQLELIRLLAGGAQLLILDEPTTGISAEQKEKLFESMRRLAHEEGKTLILVSHKLEEIQELCNHAFVLRKGELVGEAEIPCANSQLVEMMFGQLPQRSQRPEHVTDQVALNLEDVYIETYRLAVENINLKVYTGEVFGLAGLEGSGQKLLLQACAGLLSPSKGRISLCGTDITHWSYHRRQAADIAYLPAGRLEEGLISELSLTEHMSLMKPEHEFMVNWEGSKQIIAERIREFQVVGSPETLAGELSGGNQQRLLFALQRRDLKLMLLEHPTRGLDVQSADWTWSLLYERLAKGTAIVFMSADLDEIIERSDRIAVFSGGKMSRIVKAKETSVDELGHLIGGQA